MKENSFAETLKGKDQVVFSAPLAVSLEITSQCNLRCSYCYTDAGEKQERELEKKEIIELIDHLYALGVGTLTFTGGEPLCRPEFFEIAQHADEQEFTIVLSTNGTLLDKKTAYDLARSGFKTVQVSIEGNEQQHDALTGVKGSYKKALNALKNLEKAGIRGLVATTITSLNYRDITEHIKRIDTTHASAIRFLRFLPMGRGRQVGLYDVPVEEIKKVYADIQDLRDRIRLEINFSDAFNAPFFDRPSHPCTGGYTWCCVTPEGYVIPCNYFSAPDVARACGADTVREKPFIDIWRSSPFLQKFRNPQHELTGSCRKCDVSAECKGGCRAVNLSYTGDLFDAGSFCSYRQGK